MLPGLSLYRYNSISKASLPTAPRLAIHCFIMCLLAFTVPDDEGTAPLIHDYRVRVLLPCYKESADMVQATVQALLGAALPPGCTRIVYMCDDGKDPVKQVIMVCVGWGLVRHN